MNHTAVLDDVKKVYEGCTYSSLGYDLELNFSLQEIWNFLEKQGYSFILHKALVDITTHHYDMMERTNTSVAKDCLREAVAVVKSLDDLPQRWDDEQGKSVGFLTVFTNEMRRKLLGL